MRLASPRRSSSSFLVLALVLVSAGCDHKEPRADNPTQDTWTAAAATMTARLSALRDRQKILGGRISALAVPPGTEDAMLSAAITELSAAVPEMDQVCNQVEGAMNQARAEVGVALAAKDKIAAERTVKAATTGFDTAAGAALAVLDRVEPKVSAAEQIVQRLLAGLEAEVGRLRQLATAGGNLDFSDIDFRPGSAEFDFTRAASKATLDRLVQFAGTCAQLRFGITGHTSKEGTAAGNKALSLTRANAVKAYLLAQGVAAEQIVRTAGLGSTKPLVEEPDPGTPGAAELEPSVLENLRRKNRRVNVDVVAACPSPATTAAPPVATPPVRVVTPEPH